MPSSRRGAASDVERCGINRMRRRLNLSSEAVYPETGTAESHARNVKFSRIRGSIRRDPVCIAMAMGWVTECCVGS